MLIRVIGEYGLRDVELENIGASRVLDKMTGQRYEVYEPMLNLYKPIGAENSLSKMIFGFDLF